MNLQPLVHTRVEKEKTEHGWKKNRVDEGAAGGVWTLTAALAAPAGRQPRCIGRLEPWRTESLLTDSRPNKTTIFSGTIDESERVHNYTYVYLYVIFFPGKSR